MTYLPEAMHWPPPWIETERLLLRWPEAGDAAAKYEYGRDPEVARYMDWAIPGSLDPVVASIAAAAGRRESGEEYAWVVAAKPENRAIGNIACRVEGHAAELGYVFSRDCWGRGYATEAARAVLGWVCSLEGVVRIWATCDAGNLASVRVLEKLGFSREGVLRRWAVRPNLAPGVPRDAFMYARVREDASPWP